VAQAMREPLLRLDRITAGYDRDIDVLRDVSLQVHEGAVSGLIGLNGAGKSTVIKTVCGFLAPKSGAIQYLGASLAGIPTHELIDHGICCIPQESSLFPYLSVEHNLLLPLQGRPKAFARVMRQRCEEALEMFPDLKRKVGAQAGDLSGGQQKQLEFAKAWLQGPKLCLIDEPSIGLSPILAEQVFDWIERFAHAGMGVLLVDHNVRRVVKMSHHIYVLGLGRVVAAGPREDFESDLHAHVKQWLGLNC
jgi:branched-chain amino acid transport system ATP-binding protein